MSADEITFVPQRGLQLLKPEDTTPDEKPLVPGNQFLVL